MQTTLEYWNTLANQTILIGSLLSGFSIAIVANLLVSDQNSKLINRILRLATISAGCFLVSVFAMFQISMVTTPGGYITNVTTRDFFIPRVVGISTFMIGLFALSAIIALSGWAKSKKTGIFTSIVGLLTLLLILTTMLRIKY
ncbi:hypothetical protein [Aquimarina sediminis]|uniref:hypothetical protein n=1 Tax=Aquimarina sediminis TaxID=2070536 RepID=UPI000CA03122|nr:hypothetical protein [Aquimarina sediminis]